MWGDGHMFVVADPAWKAGVARAGVVWSSGNCAQKPARCVVVCVRTVEFVFKAVPYIF